MKKAAIALVSFLISSAAPANIRPYYNGLPVAKCLDETCRRPVRQTAQVYCRLAGYSGTRGERETGPVSRAFFLGSGTTCANCEALLSIVCHLDDPMLSYLYNYGPML